MNLEVETRAEIALAKGDLVQALESVRQSLSLATQTGSIFAQGLTLLTWGQILTALGSQHYPEAVQHLEAAWLAFEKGGAVLLEARVEVAQGRLLEKQGNQKAADVYYHRARAKFHEAGLDDHYL